MNFKRQTAKAALIVAVAAGMTALASCGSKQSADSESKTAGTTETPAASRPATADSALQAMIKDVAPKFNQLTYTDSETGKSITYSLYSPAGAEAGKEYPLVLVIADASEGTEAAQALTQGYGALVWATAESQAKNPCYVLVPQFSGVAVNDTYERTPEVDMVIRMLDKVAADNKVDRKRLYTTGQSTGGSIAMYYNVAYPDLFAASLFVDSHWDTAKFDSLVKQKFIYFIAGESGKAYAGLKPLEAACEAGSVGYTFAAWSDTLPETRQSELAVTMLEKGQPVNIFEFEPDSEKGSGQTYSLGSAYKNTAVRDWLFKQSR